MKNRISLYTYNYRNILLFYADFMLAQSFQPRLAYEPLSRQDAWQAEALQELLQYVQAHSPFYKGLFAKHGIEISQVRTLQDLTLLPTTTKADMQACNWSFLCVPKTEIQEYTATSGTMGQPVTIALTEGDLQRLAYNEQQSFLCADARPEDVFQLMLTLDRQFMAGMAYYQGIRQIGAALVRTGPGLPDMQWDTIQRLGTNSLVAVPSFLLRMISYAQQHGIDIKTSGVAKAVCIGEGLRNTDFSLNALAEAIHSQWPFQLYSTYAATEMQTAFTECAAGRGGHQQPDLVILEILDDDGNQLPAGAYGEITITTLGIEAMPLLRYRTGDMAAFYEEPCSCGRHSRRLGPIVGRKQQMIKYKGTTLYPPAVFNILNEIPFIQEYVVESFTSPVGTDELTLHLHTSLTADDCEAKLKPLLQAKLRVLPKLQFHSAAAIQQLQFPPASRKQIRFIDNRKGL